jgi:hypothetical protein
MPPRDSCHDEVSHALQKEGWVIYPKQARFDADVLAIIDIEATKDDIKAYVEVKCFPGANTTQEIYIAFGQYIVYRELLSHIRPNAALYLAIPDTIYNQQFTATIRNALHSNRVKMIIVDVQMEVVVQWIQ